MMSHRKMEDGWSPLATKHYCPLMAGSIDGTDETPHDRAIVRALNSEYIPNRSLKSDPEKTIFVAQLSSKVKDADLAAALSGYGEVRSAKVVRDVVTGMSKTYGFVEFSEVRYAERAFRDGGGGGGEITVCGECVLVDRERGRTLPGWRPRRLGGGWGGKKESGQLRFGGVDRPFRKPLIAAGGGQGRWPRDDQQRGNRFRDDRQRDNSFKDNRQRDNRFHDGRQRDNRFRDDRQRDNRSREYPRGNRTRDERQRDDRSSFG